MVSIVGPSGSGKSTLLNLIGGLDRPTAGEIRIDRRSVGQLSDDDLTRLRREKIGFIFQFFNHSEVPNPPSGRYATCNQIGYTACSGNQRIPP